MTNRINVPLQLWERSKKSQRVKCANKREIRLEWFSSTGKKWLFSVNRHSFVYGCCVICARATSSISKSNLNWTTHCGCTLSANTNNNNQKKWKPNKLPGIVYAIQHVQFRSQSWHLFAFLPLAGFSFCRTDRLSKRLKVARILRWWGSQNKNNGSVFIVEAQFSYHHTFYSWIT